MLIRIPTSKLNYMLFIFDNFHCNGYQINNDFIFSFLFSLDRAGASLEKFILQRCRELNLPYKPSDMVNSLNDDSDAPASKRKK